MHDTVLVTILTTVFQHHGSPVIIRNILTYVPIQPKRSCTICGRQNRRMIIRQKQEYTCATREFRSALNASYWYGDDLAIIR